MRKNKIYLLMFILGLGLGIFFGLNKVKASSPVNEPSGGETTASVYYDEYWQATRAIINTDTGYQEFTGFNGSTTATARPKMVVTKWKVHGHIHFE